MPIQWGGWASLGKPPETAFAKPFVQSNQDGRLEVFAQAKGELFNLAQLAPNGRWRENWLNKGKPAADNRVKSHVVGRNADGRLEVFAIAEDNGLWHKHQEAPNGRFSDWETRGTPAQDIKVTERFTVGRNQDGRQEVFAVASDGNVWQIFQTTPNGRWSQWTKLGQPPKKIRDGDRITVGRNIDGRQELFVIGGDDSCWHIWQVAPNVGWSDWESIGKPRDTNFDGTEPPKDRDLSEPVVQENFDGHLEVFAPGDGAFCNRWQEEGFRNGPAHIVWRPGGWNAKPKMQPDVNITRLEPALNLQNRVEVLAIGDDDALWNARQIDHEPFWSTSDNLGSPPAKVQGADHLTVGRNANGRLEVLVVGQDGAIWHIVQSGEITTS